MKKNQIKTGNRYEIKLGKNSTQVTVSSFDESHGTWLCETANGKTLRIKEPERFLKQRTGVASRSASPSDGPLHVVPLVATGAAPRGPKPLGTMSAMSAAHKVLVEEGRPMRIREIMNEALERGYCKLNGRTIFNTFNGGIRKEITNKGDESRFVRVGKGLFAAR